MDAFQRTALYLDLLRRRGNQVIQLPVQGPCEDRVYSSGFGPDRRLRFPVEIEANPLFWEHLAECAGNSNPEWVTLSASNRDASQSSI